MNNINWSEISTDIHNFLENEHEQLQAEPTAIPWVPGAQDIRRHTSSSILAPSPGLAYNEYYSSTRGHTQRHRKTQERKAILANLEAQYISRGSSRDGTSTGTPESPQGISAYALAQYSTIETESRGRRARDRCDGTLEWLRETSHQSQICGAVDCVSFSLETFSSIFYPCTRPAPYIELAISNIYQPLPLPTSLATPSRPLLQNSSPQMASPITPSMLLTSLLALEGYLDTMCAPLLPETRVIYKATGNFKEKTNLAYKSRFQSS